VTGSRIHGRQAFGQPHGVLLPRGIEFPSAVQRQLPRLVIDPRRTDAVGVKSHASDLRNALRRPGGLTHHPLIDPVLRA
jgi:hypothetical protein